MRPKPGSRIVPDISVQGFVSCELKEVSLHKALEIVLASGNFGYKEMDGYILVGTIDPESPTFRRLSDTQTVLLNYAKPTEVLASLGATYGKYATANDQNRSISITAPLDLLDHITANIVALDRAPRQVTLEARIVVIEKEDLENIGVTWDMPSASVGGFWNESLYGLDMPWGLQVGYTPDRDFTSALLLSLNLLTSNQQAYIVSNPKVMAQDGKEAEIKVTTEEYFEIVRTTGVYVESDLETIETGTILKIVPTIAGNDDITLTMATEVSDVVARGADGLPIITRRTASSTIRVKDGGTAVVAGLIDSSHTRILQGVPGYKDLPVIGHLFKNAENNNSSKQIAVFITPRLLDKCKPKYADAYDGIQGGQDITCRA